MARTALTVTDLSVNSELNPISYDTGDATNNHVLNNDGRTVLVMKNDTGAAVTVTVSSVADEAGRTGDISVSVANGDEMFVLPLPPRWWNQGGTADVHIDVDGGIKIAALSIPTQVL